MLSRKWINLHQRAYNLQTWNFTTGCHIRCGQLFSFYRCQWLNRILSYPGSTDCRMIPRLSESSRNLRFIFLFFFSFCTFKRRRRLENLRRRFLLLLLSLSLLVIYRAGCRSVSLCVTLQLGIYVVSTRDKVSRARNLFKKERERERETKERRRGEVRNLYAIVPCVCFFFVICSRWTRDNKSSTIYFPSSFLLDKIGEIRGINFDVHRFLKEI